MNGGIIGAVNLPTVNSAKGVWSLEELKLAQQQGIWPPLTTSDPYFRYVSLLLSGETATTNGAQNNTFLDSSSNTYTITRNGNTTQGSSTPYTNSWSSYYDGGANILSTPTSSEFNLSGGTFTLECWVYMLAYSGTPNRLIYFGPNGSQSSFVFSITPTGQVDCGVPFSTGGGANTGANVIPLRTWSHVAFVLNSNSASIYINGVRYGQSSGWNITSTNSNSLNIGYQNVPTVEGRFTGYVSNVRLVVGSALYSGSTLTVPTSPLTFVAGTKFLGCQDNRYLDNSQNNFSFTLTGIVRTTPFSPFSGFIFDTTYYSTKFDGTGDYLTISSPPTSIRDWSSSDFTCEAWVYPTTFTGWYYESGSPVVYGHPVLIGNNVFNSDVNFWSFGIASNTGQVRLYYFNGAAVYPALSTQTCNLNQWNHIAFTKSGSTVTYWVNGINGGSFTVSGVPQNSAGTPLTIGAGNNTYINGNVGGIRLVSGTALYTSNFTPPISPFTAVSGTSLLICQSSRQIDESTNAFTLNVNGDTKPTTFAPFTSSFVQNTEYTTALYGGSMNFDGTGDYVNMASQSALNLGTTNFTLEFWFYDTGSSLLYPTIVGTVTGWTTGSFSFRYNNTGQANKVSIHWNPAGDPFLSSSSTFASRVWHHVALTRSGNTFTLYVDGTVQATGSSSNSFNLGFGGTNIGWSAWDGAQGYFNGYITDLRLLTGVVLYTSAFVPPIAPLTAISNTTWLAKGTNAGIYDSAAINDAETIGNAQVSTSVKKYGSGSFYFDGTGDGLAFPSNSVYATGTGNFTIEGWINIANLSAVRTICGTRTPPNTTTGWNIAVLTDGNLQIYDNTGYAAMGAGSIVINTWYHFAFVRVNNVIVSYLNGVQKASTACTRDWTQSTFWVGATGGSSEVMNGYISDLRYTVGYARYTTNFTPPATSFPLY